MTVNMETGFDEQAVAEATRAQLVESLLGAYTLEQVSREDVALCQIRADYILTQSVKGDVGSFPRQRPA